MMNDLAERLNAIGALTLLFSLDGTAAEAIWRDVGAAGLSRLLADVTADAQARFLAAELLDRHGEMPTIDVGIIIAVDVEALRHAQLGNVWGMPGMLDSPAARRLIAGGEASAAALRPLLDDPRQIWFAGSIEATEANALTWRVKDIAASITAAIRKQPFDATAPTQLRDTAIAAL